VLRMTAAALAVGLFATTVSAQPVSLGDVQLDYVTAGSLSFAVLPVAAPNAALPAPVGSTLTVSQAAPVTIDVNATIHPATVDTAHPGH
jgi:hypothetical protein